jgi:hypothetical protein
MTLGTNYEMQGLPPEGLEGKGKIEFKPSPPTGWKRLHLGEPGWGLHVVELRQAG